MLIPAYGMLGAAWANGAAYGVQAAIAFGCSQRFYPIRYERGRIARAIGAALLGYVAARSIPAMPSLAGLFVRGATVMVVAGAALWMTGFFNVGELRWLNTLRIRRSGARPVTPSADTTEMAGEIVSVDVPDVTVTPPAGRDPHL